MAGPPWWSRVSCWWWTSSCSWGPAWSGRRVDRDLLADGRLESGVEREQELLDVLPVGRVEILEHGSRDEVEHGGHGAVVAGTRSPASYRRRWRRRRRRTCRSSGRGCGGERS